MIGVVPRTEASIVAAVRAALLEDDWDCYCEVTDDRGGRADLVATRGPVAAVVEAKQSLSLAVIEQAIAWRERANHVAIATWGSRRGDEDGRSTKWRPSTEFPRRLLNDLGIGLIRITSHGAVYSVEPDLGRWIRHRPRAPIFESLNPAQRLTPPGARRAYHSPFRETVLKLAALAGAEPGIALRDALKRIEHHYASDQSARSSLAGLLHEGKLAELRLDGGRLFPAARAAGAAANA